MSDDFGKTGRMVDRNRLADMMAVEGGLRNDGPFTRYNTTLSIQFPGTLVCSGRVSACTPTTSKPCL